LTGGTNDQLQFACFPMTGDGSITARYVPQVSSQHLQFGLMMRETTSPDSAHVACLIERGAKGWETRVIVRPSAGANTIEASAQDLGLPTVTQGRLLEPCWLRLTRGGNSFTASFSSDGKEWTQIGAATPSLNATLLLGIGTCSRLTSQNASASTTIMLDHVSATGWTGSIDGK
jgi:hypothetical protein